MSLLLFSAQKPCSYGATVGYACQLAPPPQWEVVFLAVGRHYMLLCHCLPAAICTGVAEVASVYGLISAAALLHCRLLRGVLRSPLSFFDTHPIGRLLNRFSGDLNALDVLLPEMLLDLAYCLAEVRSAATSLFEWNSFALCPHWLGSLWKRPTMYSDVCWPLYYSTSFIWLFHRFSFPTIVSKLLAATNSFFRQEILIWWGRMSDIRPWL